MEGESTKPRISTARSIARRLIKELGITQSPVLIGKVMDYMRKNTQITFEKWDLGDGVSGIQLDIDDSSVIGYNSTKHPHRQRFTIAHEIGHYLMGHNKGNANFNLDGTRPDEVEAKQFAAELLMPLPMLKQDLLEGVNDVKALARKYLVSEVAMWCRLSDCGLLNKLR